MKKTIKIYIVEYFYGSELQSFDIFTSKEEAEKVYKDYNNPVDEFDETSAEIIEYDLEIEC